MLAIMTDFWEDGYCEFHGEFFDIPLTTMFPAPERKIPIWIGGDSPPAARRAIAHDGYVPSFDYTGTMARIDQVLQAVGDRSAYEVMVATVMLGPSDDQLTQEFIDEMGDRGVSSMLLSGWGRQNIESLTSSPVSTVSLATKRAHLEALAEKLGLPAGTP
jgi:alkanesulfonate monooxygenase SsuD/methylene tetrahydromethanopterin reductase-like flavin-dependent oxidoreductase (luciferase family)